MKLILTVVIFCLISNLSNGQTSIYSFEVDSVAGTHKVNFSAFQGKKILIVCTASQDTSFSQYNELKQLYQLYKDSLAIVVFPTNSFNSETGNAAQTAIAYNQSATYKFPVAQKVNVKNPNIHSLYAWLTNASQNGMLNSQVNKPCFKYLINKNGQFRGVYGPRIRPMSTIMRQAIERTN